MPVLEEEVDRQVPKFADACRSVGTRGQSIHKRKHQSVDDSVDSFKTGRYLGPATGIKSMRHEGEVWYKRLARQRPRMDHPERISVGTSSVSGAVRQDTVTPDRDTASGSYIFAAMNNKGNL